MGRFDVAVIGGGLAGFIAANDVAAAGKSVVLIEKSNQMGGRAMTVKKAGAWFNLGAHALFRGGAAETIFQEMGVKITGGAPSQNATFLFQGRVITLPELLISRTLSWTAKAELLHMLRVIRKEDAAGNVPAMSLRDWMEREVRDPMVRDIFYALCRSSTYTDNPDGQFAKPVILQLRRALTTGVLYVDGGWQTIVNQLCDKAVQSGVTVMKGERVTAMDTDERIQGLRLASGETISAASVISTTPLADTREMLGRHTVLDQWAASARPAKAACLDLCLKQLPVRGRHVAFGIDIPVFFTNQSRAANLSENGHVVVHLLKYNRNEEHNSKRDERILEDAMTLLHPGWQAQVVARQFLPSMTVVHDTLHMGRFESHPGPAVPGIPGLYVAGDWASHGEMLVDASAASARRASMQVLNDLATKDLVHTEPMF